MTWPFVRRRAVASFVFSAHCVGFAVTRFKPCVRRVVRASSVVRLFVAELFMSCVHRDVRAPPFRRSFIRTCLVYACSCSRCSLVDHSFVVAPVSSCSFGRSLRWVVLTASCLCFLIRGRLVEFVVAYLSRLFIKLIGRCFFIRSVKPMASSVVRFVELSGHRLAFVRFVVLLRP